MKVGSTAIINVDMSGDSGSHWCSLYKTATSMCIYDSYARPTEDLMPVLYKNIEKANLKVKDSKYDAEQSDDSEVCGILCLAWCDIALDLGVRKALQI